MENNALKKVTNYFTRISESDDPLAIFNERASRLDLIATVPGSLFLVLFIGSYIAFSLDEKYFPINGYFIAYILVSVSFFVLVKNLRRLQWFINILNIPSRNSRFYFDFPLLLISLTLIFWCFDVTNAYKRPFFLTFYALCIASGGKTVRYWMYRWATHIVGIFYPIVYYYLYSYFVVLNNPYPTYIPHFIQVGFDSFFSIIRPPMLDVESLLLSFLRVYIAFFFNDIINVICKVLEFIFRHLSKVFANASKPSS